MKKARTTSARASARRPAPVAVPVAAPIETPPPAPPAKPKHGLGSLGRKSLDRPEIVPSLVLIPATRAAVPTAAPYSPSSSPPPSLPASKKRSAASAQDESSSAAVLYLRDELRSLLALLDEAPPSL